MLRSVGLALAPDVDLGPKRTRAVFVALRRPNGSTLEVVATATVPFVDPPSPEGRSGPRHLLVVPLGKAEVRKVFNITKTGVVAGCMVVQGVIRRNAEVRLLRDGAVLWTGRQSVSTGRAAMRWLRLGGGEIW